MASCHMPYRLAWMLVLLQGFGCSNSLLSEYCFAYAFVQPPMKVVTVPVPGTPSSCTAHSGRLEPMSVSREGNMEDHSFLQGRSQPRSATMTHLDTDPLAYTPQL
jgi:hypothetical protein